MMKPQLRDLAKKEGRQFQSLVDEAFTEVLEKHRHGRRQPEFMGAYLASVEKYGPCIRSLRNDQVHQQSRLYWP